MGWPGVDHSFSPEVEQQTYNVKNGEERTMERFRAQGLVGQYQSNIHNCGPRMRGEEGLGRSLLFGKSNGHNFSNLGKSTRITANKKNKLHPKTS